MARFEAGDYSGLAALQGVHRDFPARVGGTGKLKGLKGKGTYKGKGAADGTSTWEIEGEYELPK